MTRVRGSMRRARRRMAGITLIELTIVFAVIAVLLALAYPSYLAQVQKSRRADATAALQSLAQEQERYFARYRSYTSVVVAPSSCSGSGCGLGRSSDLSQDDYYTLSATGNATSYTVTATANGPQVDDTKCRTFTLNSTGVRGATSAGGADTGDDCW